MSMIGKFFLIPEASVRQIQAAPRSVEWVLAEADQGDSDRLLDVDKAWHCLHFLLTGTAWEGEPPLNFIVLGGVEVGDDLGYGAARLFTPVEVAAVAEALTPVQPTELRGRFDAAVMDELGIYPPGGWSEVDLASEDEGGYFIEPFVSLKALVRRGQAQGLGMLVWLS